jgi:hypothetical protein
VAEFVRVSVWLWVLPTTALPKLILAGLAVTPSPLTAVPESAILSGLPEPSLVRIRVPVVLPAVWGVNTTFKVVLCPAARVRGRFNPLVLNADVETVDCEIVRSLPPVLVTVSESVWVVPT